MLVWLIAGYAGMVVQVKLELVSGLRFWTGFLLQVRTFCFMLGLGLGAHVGISCGEVLLQVCIFEQVQQVFCFCWFMMIRL